MSDWSRRTCKSAAFTKTYINANQYYKTQFHAGGLDFKKKNKNYTLKRETGEANHRYSFFTQFLQIQSPILIPNSVAEHQMWSPSLSAHLRWITQIYLTSLPHSLETHRTPASKAHRLTVDIQYLFLFTPPSLIPQSHHQLYSRFSAMASLHFLTLFPGN